jgi:hypothetical protein
MPSFESAPHLRQKPRKGTFLGRLALGLYHRPIGALARVHAQGWRRSVAIAVGKAAMKHSAVQLRTPPLVPAPGQVAPIVFLTGAKYWWETIYCAHSLVRSAGTAIRVEFVNDGTLSERQRRRIEQAVPGMGFRPAADVETALDTWLPPARYPLLRYYREWKPILRKLTDIFCSAVGWQLLLDSDMLFFRRPGEVLQWVQSPQHYLAMRDVRNAYGYSPALLRSLAAGPIPEKVNIGVLGLNRDMIEWDRLEFWLRRLTETEGLQYNLCQGLCALLFAGTDHRLLPESEYLLLPSCAQTRDPAAVLHHYVAESKEWYYRYAWRPIAAYPPSTATG